MIMRFRTVKIWLSKGWYYAVYSVSLLLIPLITSCSSSRSSAKSSAVKEAVVADNNPAVTSPADDIIVTFDYRDRNTRDLSRMRIMYGVQPPLSPRNVNPLVVLDHKITGIDKDRLTQFDFANGSSSKEQVATLLGVKSKKLMAYKIVTGTDATSVWGQRAYYGVLDVLSKKAYRKALKSGEALDGYQLLK